MTYTFNVFQDARKDIELAYNWYELQRAGLGQVGRGQWDICYNFKNYKLTSP